MASAPFMQLYVADYLGDTQHLSCEQHGAYILLLMTMWRAGGSLPNDDVKLARIVRLSPSKWARISADVKAFFDVSDGLLTQGRLAVELEKAIQKSSKRSEAGAKGGQAKSLKDNNQPLAIATAMPCHSSDIRSHKEEKNPPDGGSTKPAKSRHSYTADFTQFWSEYPTDKLMSKTEAAKVFSRLSDEDKRSVIQSLPAFKAYCAKDATYRPVHACRYITQRRFEGFLQAAQLTETSRVVAPNTPQWNAWRAYKQSIGERTTYMEAEARAGRGYPVPTDFPPSATATAA